MLPVVIEHGVTNFRTQVAFAHGDGAHGVEKVGLAAVLQQVALGPGAQDLPHIDRVLVHGKSQHARLRRHFGQAARGFDAVELRHRHIHHTHIRLQFFRLFHRLAAIGDFCHDFHVPLRGQNHAEALTNDGVIVGKHDGGGFGGHEKS